MILWLDKKRLFMDWAQVLTIVGSNIALILIMFGSTIAIWLHTDKKIEAIQEEMKDFHGRLCAIEERNKGR
jgi:glucose uptake protein GlcU